MAEFFLILPEVLLVLTLAFVIIGEITYYGEKLRLTVLTSLIGLSAAFVQTLVSYDYEAAHIFGGSLSIDGFSLFFKSLFIILAIFTIASVSHSIEIAEEKRTEYCALILAGTLAMCLVASSSNLILAFLALSFLNVISYFLAAYGKRSIFSTEAAVKYLIFGAVANALLLYGLSILFVSTKTLNIYDMHKALLASPMQEGPFLVAFILCFLSFSFQMSSFPMSLVAPDVLEGAPTPVTAFLAMGSRTAGFAIAARFLTVVFAKPSEIPGQWLAQGTIDWTQMVSLAAGLTMASGSLLAFRQVGAKRLVSCLLVAESGFLLMGLLVLDEVGIAALLFNLVIQLFSVVGIFYILSFFIDVNQSDRLVSLRGICLPI